MVGIHAIVLRRPPSCRPVVGDIRSHLSVPHQGEGHRWLETRRWLWCIFPRLFRLRQLHIFRSRAVRLWQEHRGSKRALRVSEISPLTASGPPIASKCSPASGPPTSPTASGSPAAPGGLASPEGSIASGAATGVGGGNARGLGPGGAAL